ncbi:MAG: two-component system regulatory protein YycI [Bacillota bacterium]|nr:two-component system regulatory protein YycI [Bacillota bacterium]
MDWGKARLWLILLFALLDAYLWVQVRAEEAAWRSWAWVPPGSAAGTGSPEEASRRLQEAGVLLETNLPTEAPSLPLWTVRALPADGAALARRLFQNEHWTAEPWPGSPGSYTYIDRKTPQVRLSVLREGPVVYEEPAGSGSGPSPAEARRVADDFLGRLAWPPGGEVAFDGVEKAAGAGSGLVVHYVEVFHGRPLFGGYVAAEVQAGEVTHLEGVWLEVSGRGGASRPIMPAEEALLRLAADQGANRAQPLRVRQVQLGYYSPLYRVYEANRWDVAPVWRIRLADGSIFYVNAYTGLTEK